MFHGESNRVKLHERPRDKVSQILVPRARWLICQPGAFRDDGKQLFAIDCWLRQP